jgi:DNA mismatch endonuclease, patch repair protein
MFVCLETLKVRKAMETTADTRARMSRQRTRNTGIEMALRRELHRLGLRYRIHRRPLPGLRREADIVFGPVMVAVFVDGCFWHGCPEHTRWPKRNAEFWKAKIEGNNARDLDTDACFAAAGWTVVRVWEHEDPIDAAVNIVNLVRKLREERSGLGASSASLCSRRGLA